MGIQRNTENNNMLDVYNYYDNEDYFPVHRHRQINTAWMRRQQQQQQAALKQQRRAQAERELQYQKDLINEEKKRRIRKIELWKRKQQQQEEKDDAIFDKENKHEKIPIILRGPDGRLHQYFSNNMNKSSKIQCDGKRLLGTDKQQNRLSTKSPLYSSSTIQFDDHVTTLANDFGKKIDEERTRGGEITATPAITFSPIKYSDGGRCI